MVLDLKSSRVFMDFQKISGKNVWESLLVCPHSQKQHWSPADPMLKRCMERCLVWMIPKVAPASQQNVLRLVGQKRRGPAKRLALHLSIDHLGTLEPGVFEKKTTGASSYKLFIFP